VRCKGDLVLLHISLESGKVPKNKPPAAANSGQKVEQRAAKTLTWLQRCGDACNGFPSFIRAGECELQLACARRLRRRFQRQQQPLLTETAHSVVG
jgi:hypothetical protein